MAAGRHRVLAAGPRRAGVGRGSCCGPITTASRGSLRGTGFEEGPQAVAAGQVVCHGDIAPRNTVFADGRATAFIDWDGIFVSTPMWDLAHAVWQFALVCDDADRWLGGWSSRRAAPPACRLLRRRWQFRHAHLSLVVEIGLYAVTKLASHRNQLDRSAGLPLRSWR